jgi:hypothetical protein
VAVTNTLDYCGTELIAAVKSFIIRAPVFTNSGKDCNKKLQLKVYLHKRCDVGKTQANATAANITYLTTQSSYIYLGSKHEGFLI